MSNKLPTKYAWLASEPGPKMLLEALKEYGILEAPGAPNNPKITAWADEVGKATDTKYADWAADWYNSDAIAWCGLFVAVIACRAGDGRKERLPLHSYLSALAWAGWGVGVEKKEGPKLGDVLVFVRSGGGHVGLYVAEDSSTYHVLGGNQSNAVNITRIEKKRLYAIRRPAYKVQPANVRRVILESSGTISTNEA